MAEKRRDYAGCETFDVGRKQAVRLFHGDSAEYWYSPNHEYLIVGAACSLGDINKVGEIYVCETYEQAMAEVSRYLVDDAAALRNPHSFEGMMGVAWEYEIWHLVDDSQLWDEWERKVRVFAELVLYDRPYVTLLDRNKVDELEDWLDVCHKVERHCEIITQIERLFITARGFDFKFHGMMWRYISMSGCLYDLSYLDGRTVHVRRFVDALDFRGWKLRHADLLESCQSFAFGFLYDSRGIYAYEDLLSDDGPQDMGDIESLTCYFGLGRSPYIEGVDERVDLTDDDFGDNIPGGPLDEDIVF